jgi:hypothetical protein
MAWLTIEITKFEAARRQLDTAIELWFSDGDPVSTHALAYAAHEILHRLYRRRGLTDLMFDTSIIKDEYRNEFCKRLKESGNWFKHADKEKNPDEKWSFAPETNEIFLLICCVAISRMDYPLNAQESAFVLWNRLHKPRLFPDDRLDSIPADELRKLSHFNRDMFFDAFIAIWQQRGG